LCLKGSKAKGLRTTGIGVQALMKRKERGDRFGDPNQQPTTEEKRESHGHSRSHASSSKKGEEEPRGDFMMLRAEERSISISK